MLLVLFPPHFHVLILLKAKMVNLDNMGVEERNELLDKMEKLGVDVNACASLAECKRKLAVAEQVYSPLVLFSSPPLPFVFFYHISLPSLSLVSLYLFLSYNTYGYWKQELQIVLQDVSHAVSMLKRSYPPKDKFLQAIVNATATGIFSSTLITLFNFSMFTIFVILIISHVGTATSTFIERNFVPIALQVRCTLQRHYTCKKLQIIIRIRFVVLLSFNLGT